MNAFEKLMKRLKGAAGETHLADMQDAGELAKRIVRDVEELRSTGGELEYAASYGIEECGCRILRLDWMGTKYTMEGSCAALVGGLLANSPAGDLGLGFQLATLGSMVAGYNSVHRSTHHKVDEELEKPLIAAINAILSDMTVKFEANQDKDGDEDGEPAFEKLDDVVVAVGDVSEAQLDRFIEECDSTDRNLKGSAVLAKKARRGATLMAFLDAENTRKEAKRQSWMAIETSEFEAFSTRIIERMIERGHSSGKVLKALSKLANALVTNVGAEAADKGAADVPVQELREVMPTLH